MVAFPRHPGSRGSIALWVAGGIAALATAAGFAAASPPVAMAALGIVGFVWAGTVMAFDGEAAADEDAPRVRRSDAHPDAPPRRPIMASEELLPLAGRALPVDLETPLSAYDRAAIPDTPRAPVRPVAPLARRAAVAPGERLETFALPLPAVRAERGGFRPGATVPAATLEETLLALRKLATG